MGDTYRAGFDDQSEYFEGAVKTAARRILDEPPDDEV